MKAAALPVVLCRWRSSFKREPWKAESHTGTAGLRRAFGDSGCVRNHRPSYRSGSEATLGSVGRAHALPFAHGEAGGLSWCGADGPKCPVPDWGVVSRWKSPQFSSPAGLQASAVLKVVVQEGLCPIVFAHLLWCL